MIPCPPLCLLLHRLGFPNAFAPAFIGCTTSSRFVHGFGHPEQQCPFAALGLKPGASAEQLRTRYIELAKRVHPDAAGPKSAFDASVFIELRRNYEKALQLQQSARHCGKKQNGTFNPDYESSGGQKPPEQKRNASKAGSQEWKKDQVARQEFWAKLNAQGTARRNGVAYSMAIEDLFMRRLHAEASQKKQQIKTFNNSAALERACDAAVHAAEEEEIASEFRAFGLGDFGKYRNSTQGFGRYKSKTLKERVWSVRTVRRSLWITGCTLAVAVGVALSVLAKVLLRPPEPNDAKRGYPCI
ncbi:uncharacterized protein LOC34619027 [Cyclospora cayetanensis]|uniref:Uncharacterized protein n=2 Tax=Cyclospora cayetanensis TaxID=88456 RepID=A0A1D3CTR4_9EIME|nr:uncharacterized protein LOC34619027 [Cyclospora cayetanensis]OEH74604.1 hypothetical protein cyc_02131 [Cyclospora cayetanensis]